MSKIITHLSTLTSPSSSSSTSKISNIVIYALSSDNFKKRDAGITRSVVDEVAQKCWRILEEEENIRIHFVGDLEAL